MFILQLEQQPQGFYDLDKYVTLSFDNIIFISLTGWGDLIQWDSDWSIGEDPSFKGIHTEGIHINYQVVK